MKGSPPQSGAEKDDLDRFVFGDDLVNDVMDFGFDILGFHDQIAESAGRENGTSMGKSPY